MAARPASPATAITRPAILAVVELAVPSSNAKVMPTYPGAIHAVPNHGHTIKQAPCGVPTATNADAVVAVAVNAKVDAMDYAGTPVCAIPRVRFTVELAQQVPVAGPAVYLCKPDVHPTAAVTWGTRVFSITCSDAMEMCNVIPPATMGRYNPSKLAQEQDMG